MPPIRTIPLLGLVGFGSLSVANIAVGQNGDSEKPETVYAQAAKLPDDVKQCIRDGKPWSDCYNLLFRNADDKQVGDGFSGFHQHLFANDADVGSIWVPTPAELATRPRGRAL